MTDYEYDVVICDRNGPPGAFAPGLNAHRPTGGTEIHLCQLAEGFAKLGYKTLGTSSLPQPKINFSASVAGPDAEAQYVRIEEYEPGDRVRCKALVTCGLNGACPEWIIPDKHVILWTHLVEHNLPFMQAMRWSDFVCVSHYQAAGFPLSWKRRVLPAMIDRWIYTYAEDPKHLAKDPLKFVCLSAWWKGTAETLLLWEQMPKPPGATLHVGSPYSHPPDLKQIVERTPGCVYVELKKPEDIVFQMATAAGVFRFAKAPETFGVSDCLAQLLGARTHIFTNGDPGALAETLAPNPYVANDLATFQAGFQGAFSDPKCFLPTRDYSPDVVIPQWKHLLRL